MRKLFYLGFCLVIGLAFSCAITDYELIQDFYTGKIHDIPIGESQAQIIPAYGQVALIYPDGADNLFTQVSQNRHSGDRVLYTYNFYTTDGTYFRDYTYCVPNWVGCVVWQSEDPENPLDDPFDGTLNPDCLGARSLSILAASWRYYGECGAAGLTVDEKIDVINAGVKIGDHTLLYNLNSQNLTVLFQNQHGVQSVMPLIGSIGMEVDTRGHNAIKADISNPLLKNTFNAMADWADRHGTRETSITVLLNGVERTIQTRLLSDNLRSNARRM